MEILVVYLNAKSNSRSSVVEGFSRRTGFRSRNKRDLLWFSERHFSLSKWRIPWENKTCRTEVSFCKRYLISKRLVRVLKIATAYNPADIFTKVLLVYKVKEALKMLRVTKDWSLRRSFEVRSRTQGGARWRVSSRCFVKYQVRNMWKCFVLD